MSELPTVLGYMREQPERLRFVLDSKASFVNPFVEVIKRNNIKKVLFFGSGTSYNVSVISAYYFKHLANVMAEAHYPTVFQNYEKADWSGLIKKEEILFVGISQSGTSISTVNVMKHAKEKGYHTLALTSNLDSEITKHVDVKVHLLVGDELLPPETKGYTVSLLTTYLWAVAVGEYKQHLSSTEYQKQFKEINYLVDNFQTVIEESEKWYETNKASIVHSDRIYVIGYGIDYGSALEGMLKIGEMLRLPTLGYEIEEYSHGPTMAIRDNQTLLMIGSEEPELERMLHFRDVFKRYTSRVHVISCVDIERDDSDCVFSLKVNKYIAPLMYTVPMQFVAAKGALDIGIDTAINPFSEQLAHL